MIRTITFTVDNNLHVSPSSPQEAGVQGDDGATKVYFVLPSDDKLSGFRSYDFYLEMVDAAGNYDISDKLTVGTDGKVGYALPAAWTQCGGLIQLRLVAKSGSEIAYTFAGQITVAKRAAAKLSLLPKFKEMVLTTIEKCKEAIAASASAVSSAAIAAESAKETQDFAADAAGNRNVAEQSATAAEQSATAAETAASNAESAKSAAESAGLTVVGYLESTAGSKEAAAASAAAAEERAASAAVSATDAAQYAEAAKTASAAAAEDAASAVRSATAAEQSATAAGQSAAAAAASAAGAAQSAAELENVGALTLIDSVTLTEAVASYSKTLPANTYREIYVAAKIKLGGTINKDRVMFSALEKQSGHRVCAVSSTFTAGNTAYVYARLLRLPSRGTCGIISCGQFGYYNAQTSMTPGQGDDASAGEFLEGLYISVSPEYTENKTHMDIGTKIQIWGR